jgi:hypothetical protein
MKTTVDVDRAAAEEASAILGTTTLKDTVNAALRAVVDAEHRRRLADLVESGTLPVPTPEEVARLRAPRVPVGFADKLLDVRPRRH